MSVSLEDGTNGEAQQMELDETFRERNDEPLECVGGRTSVFYSVRERNSLDISPALQNTPVRPPTQKSVFSLT